MSTPRSQEPQELIRDEPRSSTVCTVQRANQRLSGLGGGESDPQNGGTIRPDFNPQLLLPTNLISQRLTCGPVMWAFSPHSGPLHLPFPLPKTGSSSSTRFPFPCHFPEQLAPPPHHTSLILFIIGLMFTSVHWFITCLPNQNLRTLSISITAVCSL